MSTAVQARKSFLVVDDEPLVRMDMADLIRDQGYDAWEAGNVAEALSILETAGDSFVGLITDVNMPGTRSGLVLANHVRAVWPHIRVIVVSAGRKPFAGELPEDTAFIAKPWQAEQVVMAIGQA
jgi:two-component system, response regulator PdtaR